MRRRSFITVGTLAMGSAMTGCLADSAPDDDGDATTPTADEDATTSTADEDTTTPTADIDVVLYNGTDGTLGVSVVVRTDEGDTLAERGLTLEADERREIPSQISETGNYEIRLTVGEDREQTFSTNIEDYDLEMGSNQIVRIHESEMTFLVEE